SRTAVKTTILPTGGGFYRKSPVLIPEGSTVAYSVYAMHRRPDLYGMDAEVFRPERWEGEMPLNSNPVNTKWGYLPFNGGPRICLGSTSTFCPLLHVPNDETDVFLYAVDFALTEAAYTVV